MRIAEVILDIPTQALDAPYTYLVPEAFDDAEIGCAVLVPLGGRKAVGFIMALGGEEPADDAAPSERKLKPIEQVLSKPYFNEAGALCARFLSERYVAPLSTCVRLFTPPGGIPRIVRDRFGAYRLEEPAVGEVDDRWVVAGPEMDAVKPRKNAVKQQAVLEAVRRGDVRMAELTLEYGNVAAAVRALADKGAVKMERRRRMRGTDAPAAPARPYARPEALTESQSAALRTIEGAQSASDGRVVVVDGVTGSGKTEVYLRAIERELAAGRNAIVLVPEISLTPQTVARFRSRFGQTVAVMHSRMSMGERYDQWDLIREGGARVVVGARSALFTPLRDVGLIVIDEEHETTYKQESAPRYVSRDVAEWMMRQSGGTLVLGSATPSIEALFKARTEEGWSFVEMPERANGSPLPRVEVVDMSAEFSSGARSMFSARLRTALIEELSAGRKAVLLLNQRGFASFLLCRDCGFVPECVNCSTSLTFHEKGNKLVCHHCGYAVPAPPVCPECESPYLKRFGAGTQRVEAELRGLLDAEMGVEPEAVPIVRMDADTTSAKGAHQRLLESFAAAPRAVLLGTQMIAKGLDFDDVTLVGVVNADTQLHLPDYRAAERTFDLIEQVAGRAGRGALPGRVIVQTYEADSMAIRAAARYDREAFLVPELQKRKVLRYPPYVRMANLLVWGADEALVRAEAQAMQQLLERAIAELGPGWEVLPANPCVIAKVRNSYRWHVVVKGPRECDMAAALRGAIAERKASKQVSRALDIDPVDLL